MFKVDWSKPIQTRNGLPARVICANLKGSKPVVVAVLEGEEEHVFKHSIDGVFTRFGESLLDIINIPEKDD